MIAFIVNQNIFIKGSSNELFILDIFKYPRFKKKLKVK